MKGVQIEARHVSWDLAFADLQYYEMQCNLTIDRRHRSRPRERSWDYSECLNGMWDNKSLHFEKSLSSVWSIRWKYNWKANVFFKVQNFSIWERRHLYE